MARPAPPGGVSHRDLQPVSRIAAGNPPLRLVVSQAFRLQSPDPYRSPRGALGFLSRAVEGRTSRSEAWMPRTVARRSTTSMLAA